MSISKVLRQSVRCDTCTAIFETAETTAYAARILAGVQGWRYAHGRLPAPGAHGQRDWDYCPDCWPTSPFAGAAS